MREEDIRYPTPHTCMDCLKESDCDNHPLQLPFPQPEDEKDGREKCRAMAFGSLYRPCSKHCIREDIDFTEAGPSHRLGVSVENNIFTIEQGGVYSISFSVTLELKKCRYATKGVGVYVNGDLLNTSIAQLSLQPPKEQRAIMHAIATTGKTIQTLLCRGDIVTLAFTDCQTDNSITYSNAAFTIAQLI